jgi:hypothetical protein
MQLGFRPVFAISAPRSGSTVFRLVLNSHPALAIAPPTWLYEMFHGFLYSYGDLSLRPNFLALAQDIVDCPIIQYGKFDLDAESLAGLAREQSFAGLYEALHRHWAERTGKTRWGQKTPRNSFWMREILADFPDAQFLHIVRDGRDVAIDLSQSPNFRPDNLYAGATLWKRYVGAIRETVARCGLKSDQYMEIKYEEFCATPEQECRRICEFIGEPWSEQMLMHHEQQDTKAWSGHAAHAKTGRPITTDYCWMWKKQLSIQDVAMITTVQREELLHYGFPVETDDFELDPLDVAKWTENEMPTAAFMLDYKNELQTRRRVRAEASVYDPNARPLKVWGMY